MRPASLILAALVACKPSRPTVYGAELAACTELARSLCESVACENDARRRFGRPLRPMPEACQ